VRRDRIVTSIDGRSVAVVADDVHVSVLEAQTGRQIGTMKAPAPVFDVAPGSDGTWMIATAASDGSPSLISFPDGREIRRLTAAGGVTSMALSRDGRYAVTVGADAWRLHDLRDGRELGPPTPVNDGSTPVFSADGNTIAMGGQDTPGSSYTSGRQEPAYRAFVFDTARQKPTIKSALAGKVQSLALTRDGRFLVAGDAGAARVWDLTDGSEPSRMTTGTPLASVAISDDARVVVTAGADGTTRAFDTHGGAEIARATIECLAKPAPDGATTAPETPPCGARAVALSPDGRLVFSAGEDGMLRVFEPLGASDEARITEDLPVTAIALARAGQRLVVGSAADGREPVRVVDAAVWRERQRIEAKAPEVRGLAVSADGRFVMVASNWTDGPLLFDLNASEKTWRALGGPANSSSVTLSGDGSSAAWIDGQAVRFDQASGKGVPLPGLTQAQAIALSDDGRIAVVGTGNMEVGEVVVLQLPAGTPTARVPFVGPPMFVAVSPDGSWVAASKGIQGMGDNTIHVIDASAGQIRWKHAGAPNTPIAFTHDGRTVAMASADGTLRTFETASGRETFRIPLEERPVMALAFDEQAASLTAASLIRTLTGASGVTVKKYLLRRDDVVAHACSRLSRNLTKPEWTQYVGADATHNATCAALRLGEH
jgi:WD40 repeat protein